MAQRLAGAKVTKRLDRDERGLAIVEFALVVVLFFGLCFATVDLGYAFTIREDMIHAAQEGLREALVQTDPNAMNLQAVTGARSRLEGSFGAAAKSIGATRSDPSCNADGVATGNGADICTNFTAASSTFGACPNDNSSKCLQIEIWYDYTDNSLLGAADAIPGWGHIFPREIHVTVYQRVS